MASVPDPFDSPHIEIDDTERRLSGPFDDPVAADAESGAEEDARRQLAAEQARRFAEDQARHEALHDPHTRLPNRALCLDRLVHALATTVWTRTCVAVLALGVELDRPGLGDERADELLKAVAGRLVEVVGAGDTVARLEGDRIALVTEGIAEESDGVALAERLIGTFDPPFLVGGLPIPAQVCIGVVVSKDRHAEAATVLDEAEAALVAALEKGPGRYEMIGGAERKVVAAQRAEAELRLAVERGELRVFFQPLYTLDLGHPFGAEALIRWEHPQRGLLPPGEFLPIAEQSDLIADIGEWVLGEACAQAMSWPLPNEGKPLLLTVNLSPRQLAHPGLPDAVQRVLERTGIEPARVGLEVSEDAFMQDPVGGDALVRLKEMGVRLLLDDVDADSSPLGDMGRVSFDDLKLDRGLIQALDGKDFVAEAAVESIVADARGRGVGVIAEGVESITQLERLSQLGIALGQGYYFSRPLPATGMDALVRRANAPAVMFDD
jgi:EAL domain-containing protein (putative c-di-GMP-specific phosphodiesterase class I)/GGDEF domain-containing protein